MFRPLLTAMTVLGLALSANAGKLPGSWQEIMKDPSIVKYPTAQDLHEQAVPKSATGEWQFWVEGGRFGFLFDPEGHPVITFDLTQDHIGLGQAILGSMGIGQFSLYRLFKTYKDATSQDKYLEMSEKVENDLNTQAGNIPPNPQDIQKGYEEFAKYEFVDEWISRHNPAALRDGRKSGFRPASFTLGDFRYDEKQMGELHKIMNAFSKVLYREALPASETRNFAKMFQMEWNDAKQEFTMKWDASSYRSNGRAKRPNIPDWVVNFQVPTDILAYKYYLRNIEQTSEIAEYLLGAYGRIITALISKTCDNMKARMDSHENQLAGLLEAALRDQYKFEMPLLKKKAFLNATLDTLYVNKMIDSQDITNGAQKRKLVYEEEAKNRDAVLKWLDKKKYTYKEWSDNRFATVYKGDKRVGVVSTAIKPLWLFKTPSFHYYDNFCWGKTATRLGLEALVVAIRYYLPSQMNLPINLGSVPINISLYLPGLLWDMLFKGRMFTEIGYEGYAIANINEAMGGAMAEPAGYTIDEAAAMRKNLMVQRVNPFEIPAAQESKAISHNFNLLKKFFEGGKYNLSEVYYIDQNLAAH